MKKAVNLEFKPIVHEEWWEHHVKYYVFDRQGLDITCAEFHNPKAKANIIFLTDWNESFLKYADMIKNLYEGNFSVFTYDHQSQGLSGRWLTETQLTWVHSFHDYVDDFVSFVNTIAKEHPQHPMYLIAHSMGCLISSIGIHMIHNI
jgi:lysophospholipase